MLGNINSLMCVFQMISAGMSSKILKEALLQQKELDEEEAEGSRLNEVFTSVGGERNKHDDEEDIDDFGGFSETQSQFGNYEVTV